MATTISGRPRDKPVPSAPLKVSETKWPVQPNTLARGVAVRGNVGAGVGVGVAACVGLAFCLSDGVAVTVAVEVGVGLGVSVAWSTVWRSAAVLVLLLPMDVGKQTDQRNSRHSGRQRICWIPWLG
jgi:hypothetical protein